MREIDRHKSNPVNSQLKIEAVEENGSDINRYRISGFDAGGDPTLDSVELLFQMGPMKEVGVNGITNEALLAIVADRLAAFQRSQYSCVENSMALSAVWDAIDWLQRRTRRRTEEGVEGTSAL